MIKKLLPLTIAILTLNAISAQEAPEVQNSLIAKIAATWCPPCGGWGWGFFHDLEEDNQAKALSIAVHHSGDLVNSTATDFANNFDAPYQPWFYLNNEDQDVQSSNTSIRRTEIQDKVNNYATQSPTANTGLKAILDDGIITVQTNTKFFQNATGEYYLGIYVVEDEVANFQATVGSGAIHTNILRGGLSSNSFGEAISTGDVAANTEITMEFSTEVNSGWNLDNVTMAAIIWKLEAGTYTFVNTNSTNTFEDPIASGLNEHLNSAKWSMKIQPTISNGNATVLVDLPTNSEAFDLVVYNQMGQAVTTLHQGKLDAGLHTFTLNTQLSKGIYFVKSGNENSLETKRMLVH